jgi:hypothetical protein
VFWTWRKLSTTIYAEARVIWMPCEATLSLTLFWTFLFAPFLFWTWCSKYVFCPHLSNFFFLYSLTGIPDPSLLSCLSLLLRVFE